MTIETLNMLSAPLSVILKQIERQISDGDLTPVTLLGKSGIGKTEGIRDLAASLKIGFREIRLSHYQESDLIGLPYIDEAGRTRHAPADLLPPTGDTGSGILLLDEVTSAPRSMRSAVYQLLDTSRRLGEYALPPRWLVVACGNGPDDGGDFRGIEPAFMSRGFCWRVQESLEDWKVWALNHDVHPAVVAYLTYDPDQLHVMDPDRPLDMIACPRNWVKLSTQLKNLEARSQDGAVSVSDLEFSAAGAVGRLSGAPFAAFYRCRALIPNPDDILEGRSSASDLRGKPDEILYMTTQAVVRHLADSLAEDAPLSDAAPSPDSKGFRQLINAINWLIDIGTDIRLDAAVAALQDIGTALGSRVDALILSDAFDEACPRFAAFAQENAFTF